jgi:hypothetical protein
MKDFTNVKYVTFITQRQKEECRKMMDIQKIVSKYGGDNILILDPDHPEDRFSISEIIYPLLRGYKIDLRSPKTSIRYYISDFNQLVKQGLIKIFINASTITDTDNSMVTSGGVIWEQSSELFKGQEGSDPISSGEG